MKRFFTFTLFLLIPALLLSQSKTILLPGGKVMDRSDEARMVKKQIMEYGNFSKAVPYDVVQGVSGTPDTLFWRAWDGTWGSTFGYSGQDVMVQWFEAPTEMYIHSVYFVPSEFDDDQVSVKIVKLNWTKDQIMDAGVTYWGYYSAPGNEYNDIEPFLQNDHGENVTDEDWVDTDASEPGSPFGEDLWSDGGYGAPVTTSEQVQVWVEMSQLGFSPQVQGGDIFGVVVKNVNPDFTSTVRAAILADANTGVGGFKFYANGRLATGGPGVGDCGWWSREFSWNMGVAVELTGDRPPVISDMDALPTTLSQDTRTVTATITDDNPSGGPAGISVANLLYTLDGGDTITVAMSAAGDVFSGDIPGQSPGTEVTYWIEATDVEGLMTSNDALAVTYTIFLPTSDNLLVFNGFTTPSGYPQSYYFGQDDFDNYNTVNWDHDVWSYTALTEELVNYYTNIIEITSGGPNYLNNDVIAAWLDADASHNYALAGDEWLGVQYGWPTDPTVIDIPAEDFANAYMGITTYYSDIVLYGSTGPSHFKTVAGSMLGDPLDAKVDETEIPRDSLFINPNFEIGVANWLDGTAITEDGETFLMADTSGIDFSIGHTRTLTAGNKIAFFSYDPLSLDAGFDPDSYDPEDHPERSNVYYWYGFSLAAPQVQLLTWFGIDFAVGLENEAGSVAKSFNLKQNYPNPFNPTTTIEYTIPATEKVQIKVYNIIGKEVATLVNGKIAAGSHTVEFDASKLASGLYIYQLKAGKNISSKKMLLVK